MSYMVPPYGHTPCPLVREQTENDKRTLKLNGKGTLKVRPDIAVINFGVMTEGKDLAAAQSENAAKSAQLLNALKSAGVSEKDIKTGNYSITPEYDYVEGKQILRGYRVVNSFTVTIRDIEKVGAIIDLAVKNGANMVNSISFTLSDPTTYYNRALNLAIQDAIGKAQSIERSLDIRVDKIPVKIQEESLGYGPVEETAVMKTAMAAETPIEPGQIEISATVVADFNYQE